MRVYKKYKIVKENGNFYIEVPIFFGLFSTRLSYYEEEDIGYNSYSVKYYHTFVTYNMALKFAEDNMYKFYKGYNK